MSKFKNSLMQVYPVFLPLKGCPFRCIYCDQYLITGSDHFNLDEHLSDIAKFCNKHRDQEKEIAFFGGTFTALSLAWQKEQYQKLQEFIDEKTGIRFSTRPDCLDNDNLTLARDNHVRTIELGIQDFSDQVLQKSRRGYSQQRAILGCKKVKDFGFNLGIQIMPGLPGFSEDSLEETSKLILQLKPKYVRIYPTIVLANTELAKEYFQGKYSPLDLDKALQISAKLHERFTDSGIKVIKTGVQIDSLTPESIIAGPHHRAFGELVQSIILGNKIKEQISSQVSEVHIKCSKHYVSKLRGHNSYGVKYLEKILPDKIINLTIDNTDKEFYIIIITK